LDPTAKEVYIAGDIRHFSVLPLFFKILLSTESGDIYNDHYFLPSGKKEENISSKCL